MTREEIIRYLRRCRYDPAMRADAPNTRSSLASKRARQHVSSRVIADLARMGRQEVDDICTGAIPLTSGWRRRLSSAIEQIESTRTRFIRTNPKETGAWWRIEYHKPPAKRPPPEEKLTRAADHREWARCRSCAGDVWQGIFIRNEPWYACVSCVPATQWPAMGARKADQRRLFARHSEVMQEDFSLLTERE